MDQVSYVTSQLKHLVCKM